MTPAALTWPGRAKFGRLAFPEAQLSQMRIFVLVQIFLGGREL